jgi:hypothetical protein
LSVRKGGQRRRRIVVIGAIAAHWCHDDAVGQEVGAQPKWLEELACSASISHDDLLRSSFPGCDEDCT